MRREEKHAVLVFESSGWQPGTLAKVCCCGLPAQRSRGSAGANITPLHRRGSSQPQRPMPRRLASNPTILWCVSLMKEEASGPQWELLELYQFRAECSTFRLWNSHCYMIWFDKTQHKSSQLHTELCSNCHQIPQRDRNQQFSCLSLSTFCGILLHPYLLLHKN